MLFAARGGILGNEHPYTPLVGAGTSTSVEAGYRWHSERRWSFYTGVGAGGDFALMTRPGTNIVQLRTLNDMDGVGGRTADGAIRLDAGISLLDGPRSLLVVAFYQEALRAPGIYTPGAAFAEGGVAARFDLAWSLTASLAALGGRTGVTADASLGTTNRSIYAGISADVRKIFGNGMWIAVAGGYSREFERPRLCRDARRVRLGERPHVRRHAHLRRPHRRPRRFEAIEHARTKVHWRTSEATSEAPSVAALLTAACLAASAIGCDPQRSDWGLSAILTMTTPPDNPGLGCGVVLPPDPAAEARARCAFGTGAPVSATLGIDAATVKAIPIRHVIILMKENRSFDHLLGKLHEERPAGRGGRSPRRSRTRTTRATPSTRSTRPPPAGPTTPGTSSRATGRASTAAGSTASYATRRAPRRQTARS